MSTIMSSSCKGTMGNLLTRMLKPEYKWMPIDRSLLFQDVDLQHNKSLVGSMQINHKVFKPEG